MSRWDVEWLVVDENGCRSVPAYRFLRALPQGPRELLLAIVDGVRHTGPDNWLDPTHKSMHGSCAHLHEARDRQGQELHRLFLYWQRHEQRVVLIDGRTKKNNTTMADEAYDEIATLSRLAEGDDPAFATFDDFARAELAWAAARRDRRG